MFLTDSQARTKVKNIIEDDVDNDIVFVVAHKGIGKTCFLEAICVQTPYDCGYIIADGSNVKGNEPSLKKCFSVGIIEYLSRDNSLKNRRKINKKLDGLLSKSDKAILLFGRKIRKQILEQAFCNLSLNELKTFYYELADNTPLVIVSKAMVLTDEEIKYLKELNNDNLGSIGARITFLIGIRAEPANLKVLDSIIKCKRNGIWIMPLLPRITKTGAINDPKSFSSINIENFGEVNDLHGLKELVSSNEVYLDTFEIARHVADSNLNPVQLFVLANQDVSLKNYEIICDIVKSIYRGGVPNYDNKLLLPNNGKLLWIDVISYYIVLQDNIDTALRCTQEFYLKIIGDFIQRPQCYDFGQPIRKELSSFINDVRSLNNNLLANGFAHYYSDFALFLKIFFLNKRRGKHYAYTESISAAEVLGRVALLFSENCIAVLEAVHMKTQTCYVLDIGVETIRYYLVGIPIDQQISESDRRVISVFLGRALSEAYRWNDITLADHIIELYSVINNVVDIRIGAKYLYESLIHNAISVDDILKKYNLSRGDVFMQIKSLFISYNHKNKDVAIKIEENLTNIGYKIVRDETHLKTWDSLKEFMRTIRKYEFVIFVISDSYLRSDNCLYEVTQFLKDEEYKKKALPIVIDFSDEENVERKSRNLSTSVFSTEYKAEIVAFWDNRTKQLNEQIKDIDIQNSVELAGKYRDILNMAQSVSTFVFSFLDEDYLPVVKSDNSNLSEITDEMNTKIVETL